MKVSTGTNSPVRKPSSTRPAADLRAPDVTAALQIGAAWSGSVVAIAVVLAVNRRVIAGRIALIISSITIVGAVAAVTIPGLRGCHRPAHNSAGGQAVTGAPARPGAPTGTGPTTGADVTTSTDVTSGAGNTAATDATATIGPDRAHGLHV